MEIRDGEKHYSVPYLSPIGGFTGNSSYSVVASSNVIWIKFHSDPSVTAKGFNLTYEAIGNFGYFGGVCKLSFCISNKVKIKGQMTNVKRERS